MKNCISNILGLGCALLMVQCTSDDFQNGEWNVPQGSGIEVRQVPFHSDSRTLTTPEGGVSWDAYDRLKVFVVDHKLDVPKPAEWAKMGFLYVTDAENCAKNFFMPAPYGEQPEFYHKHSYDWYVMSPFSEDVTNPLGSKEGQVGFELGNQEQEFDSPMKHLTKVDVLTSVEKNVLAGTQPSMALHHKGTLMKFTIKNGEDKPLKLSKVVFEVPTGVCIGGKFAVDFNEGGAMFPMKEYNAVTLAIRDAQPLKSGESYDVYVMMAPFTLKAGQTFKIRVYSDLGRFTQSAAMAKDLAFSAGKLNTASVQVKGSEFDNGRVIIPDKNFENYLMKNFNVDGDGMISEDEAKLITAINVNSMQIQSLEGIEYMPNLKSLACQSNQLKYLDLSKNVKLAELNCGRNQLEALNISMCDSLTSLSCPNNQLTKLYIGGNVPLSQLNCSANKLEVLDLKECSHLRSLNCASNQLTELSVRNNGANLTSLNCSSNLLKGELDISENYNLYSLDTRKNAELMSILVWDGFEEPHSDYPYYGSNFNKDPHTSYLRVKDESPVCQIPDENFKKYLLGKFDRNKDGEISEFEAKAVVSIEVNTENIVSLDGLRYFPNLETLKASGQASNYMGQLKSLDISNNVKLTQLECRFNLLDQLDVSRNKLLRSLDCDWNQLTQLDISANTSLETLSCENNAFQVLDFGSHPALKELDCGYNDLLVELHVKEMPKLERLSFRYTPIQKLDLRDAKSIYSINCERNASLVSIDAENAQSLSQVECAGNALRSLNFRNCTSLGYVNCRGNKLEMLNVDQCHKLGSLDCSYNRLRSLNVSDAVNITDISCSNNLLESMDISKNKKLDYFHVIKNPNLNIIYVWKGFLKSGLSCFVDSHVQFVEKE